jgi:formylglycine-generating enzyme required for sulfatase activity
MKKIVLATVVGMFYLSMANAGNNERVLINKNTNTYIDAHEVTIGDWAEYLADRKIAFGNKPEYYQECLPNHAVCVKAYGAEDYLTNSHFQNYPIVGLTYMQMVAYCGWRTDKTNKILLSKNSSEKYLYSLPEEVDLQAAYDLQKSNAQSHKLASMDVNTKTIVGLSDNAREMTANKKVVVGVTSYGLRFEKAPETADPMIGFRCKCVKIN